MALQVAGVEKINSMDFCRASVYRANFSGSSNTKIEAKNECNERPQRISDLTVRAGSPRSHGFNIFHKATKKYYGCKL